MKKQYVVEYSTDSVNTGSDILAGVGVVVMVMFAISCVLHFVM